MKTPHPEAPPATLVIGLGNTLRRDEGAGLRVAEAVESWHRPGVTVVSLHQVAPEMAEEIAKARVVIFVTARAGSEADEVAVGPLQPSAGGSAESHTRDAAFLLELARVLQGRCPESWIVTIPAVDRGQGEELSPTATRGIAAALDEVRRLLDGAGA